MYFLSVLAGEEEKSYPLKDAGVVGIPDEESGEVPRAFIVRAPSSTITGGPIILRLVRFFKIVDFDIGGVQMNVHQRKRSAKKWPKEWQLTNS